MYCVTVACRTGAARSFAAAAAAGPGQTDGYEQELCVVCWECRRSVALVHGDDAHLCLCTACSQQYDHQAKGCPMCRRAVEFVLPIYSC
ncbi:hypothetical protein OEZ86_012525 [Tetradesmus obliquus]|nr:hypothetical protein OEZ86_012525 [Tetradesmus obliquus]